MFGKTKFYTSKLILIFTLKQIRFEPSKIQSRFRLRSTGKDLNLQKNIKFDEKIMMKLKKKDKEREILMRKFLG